jgi:hypothetical protein
MDKRRIEQHLAQTEAVKRLHLSQSSDANREAAGKSVAMDLVLKPFPKPGNTREMMAAALEPETKGDVAKKVDKPLLKGPPSAQGPWRYG